MIKPLSLFLFFTVFFDLNIVSAQNNDSATPPQNSISVTSLNGLSIFSAENNTMKGFAWGLEAAYNLNLQNNASYWVKLLNAKNIGLAFSYRNMDNVYLTQRAGTTGFLGNAYALIARLDLSIYQTRRFGLLLAPGFGFAYVTKDYRTNYNPLVGTHVNFAAQLGLKLQAPISSSTAIQAGLSLFHFSNAAYKLPNDGINTINTTIGIVQNINVTHNNPNALAFNIDDKKAIELGIGFGHRGLLQVDKQVISQEDSIKQEYATSRLNYLAFYGGYNYRVSKLFSVKAATDITYYFTTYDINRNLATSQEFGTSYDRFSVGASLGGDIWLGRLVFEGNYGYYLHFKYGFTPVHFYWTFGAKYYLTPWMALEAKESLHETEAHYASFGLLFHIHQ